MLDAKHFDEMDKDGDGKIDSHELYKYEQSKTVGNLLAQIDDEHKQALFVEEKGRAHSDILDLNLRNEVLMDIVADVAGGEGEENGGMGALPLQATTTQLQQELAVDGDT